MLPSDHPLASLQAQAALASRWPTLHAFRHSETAVLEARAAVEGLLGPLPQADVIEPWDPEDPQEPWELRIDFPAMQAATWLAVHDALPDAVLVPGLQLGARAARDQGYHLEERIEAGGLVATMTCREDGGVVVPDLQNGEPDPVMLALEREVALALQAGGVSIPFASPRGPDTLVPVVHRTTGRFGVQLEFSPEHLDAMSGDQVQATREAIVAAVAALVHARAEHPVLRLAPDLAWDMTWGFRLLVWLVGPAAASLPGDQPAAPGRTPADVGRLLAGLDGLVEEVEVQVVPRDAASHDRVAEAVIARAADSAVPLVGALPRWLRRGAWSFSPVWRVALPVDVGAFEAELEAIAALDGVAAVRVVPGEPQGLGEAWGQCDPAWHLASARWWMRIRDGLTDRDRLPEVQERPLDARDRALVTDLARALEALGGRVAAVSGLVRGVADGAGRAGVEIRLASRGAAEDPMRAALDIAGALEPDALCALGHWGYRDGAPFVVLWWRA